MLIGYARVSTNVQDLSLQLDALEKAGCKKVFTDKVSGKNRERKGLEQALSHLREGDIFVVWRLDRVGRSLKDLMTFVRELEQQGVEFRSLKDTIDTTTPHGRFFFHIMGSLAQMERELISERTRAGLKAARKRGRIGGRPRQMTDGKIKAAKKLLADGMPARDVATYLNISIPTLYRWIPASESNEVYSSSL